MGVIPPSPALYCQYCTQLPSLLFVHDNKKMIQTCACYLGEGFLSVFDFSEGGCAFMPKVCYSSYGAISRTVLWCWGEDFCLSSNHPCTPVALYSEEEKVWLIAAPVFTFLMFYYLNTSCFSFHSRHKRGICML